MAQKKPARRLTPTRKLRKRDIVTVAMLLGLIGVALIYRSFAGTAPTVGAGPFSFIYVGLRPEADVEAEYAALTAKVSSTSTVALRAYIFDKNDVKITTWETKGLNYYYTVASSDFVAYQSQPLYVPAGDAATVLARPHNKGLYIHELMAYRAKLDNWNWNQAATEVDWQLINSWVVAARAQGKKLVWAEPSQGWTAINNNATARTYLSQWQDTLVPMFSTNFASPTNQVPIARDGALAVATAYNMPLGESVQSWNWADRGLTFTAADVTALMKYGYDVGTSYFQIEGTYSDLSPTSTYMQAVNDYAALIAPKESVPPPDTSAPDTTITGHPAASTSATAASFTFSGTDNVTAAGSLTFECKLDSGSYAACTSPKAYTGLGLGSHTFSVRAKDAAGNIDASPATYTWTVQTSPDTTAPSVPSGLTASNITQTGATLTWNASTDTGGSGLAGYHLYRNGVLIASPGATSYTDSGLAPGTTYSYTVSAYDTAANVSVASSPRTVTTQSTPTTPTHVPGDGNGDGHVYLNDLTAVLINFGAGTPGGAPAVTPYTKGDCTGDGKVTLSDLTAVLVHFEG